MFGCRNSPTSTKRLTGGGSEGRYLPNVFWLASGSSLTHYNTRTSDIDQKNSPRSFATTHWSVVLVAGRKSSPDVDAALAVAEYPMPRAPHFDLGRNRLLSDALALVPPDSFHAGLLLSEYGSALYYEVGDYEGAQEAFGRALAIAEKERDQALEMRVLTNSTQVDLWALTWEEVPLKGRRAIELARSLDDPMFQVTASYVTASTLAAMGRRQEAQRLAEAMLAPAENLRSLTPLMDALWSNGTLHRSVGNWQDARSFLERGVELHPEGAQPNSDLAVLNHQVGDLVQGRENIDALLENPPAGVT